MSHLIGSISPSFLITQKFLCFGSLSSRHLECVQWTRKAKGRHRFFFFQYEQNEIYRNSFIHTILEWVFSHVQASLVAQMVKNLPAMQETWVWSLVWEKSPEGKSPTPVFLPEEFHGQKSLEGYSPWGRRVRHDWVTSTHRLLSPCFAVVVFKFFCMCFTSLYFIYFCCLNISPLSSCI